MTDKIEPALTPEEWARIEAGNGIPYATGSSILDELPYLEGRDVPIAIAYLNHSLPDGDRRKITHEWVDALRAHIEYDNFEPLDHIVAALESLLPPRDA